MQKKLGNQRAMDFLKKFLVYNEKVAIQNTYVFQSPLEFAVRECVMHIIFSLHSITNCKITIFIGEII